MPAAGSSSMISFGSAISARPSSSSFFCPPERSIARLSPTMQKIELARDLDRALRAALPRARARASRAQHGGAERLARLMLAVQHQVLDHGELGEAARDLEGARRGPTLGEPVRPPAGDVSAGEMHRVRRSAAARR